MKTGSFDNRSSWIGRRTVEGGQGIERLHAFLRTAYSRPLHQLAELVQTPDADPATLVKEFLEEIVKWDLFFAMWHGSGLRLHRWLLEQFLRFLSKKTPESNRSSKREALPSQASEVEKQFERFCSLSFVHYALQRLRRTLERGGNATDWAVFSAHFLRGQSFVDIGRKHRLDPDQCQKTFGDIRGRFLSELRALLDRDGVPEKTMESELRALLENLADPRS